ncbi:glycoside hydrolase family 10 protein [Thermostichus vulcanus]|uniref:glycoside hydrolase family 10 protein n=1 Tax=Thermostichus vulcanus TaxID=32053 RepID=UPI001FCC42A7
MNSTRPYPLGAILKPLGLGLGLLLASLFLWTGSLTWHWAAHSQTPALTDELTVVRLPGQNWANIERQLQRSSLTYQVIDQLNPAVLQGRKIVFLPNVNRLTPAQATALSEWMQREGGQVIVSGPLEIPAEARDPLRNLIGAYWSGDIPIASPVRLTGFAGEWARGVTANDAIAGGALLPTGTESRLTAVWEGVGGDAYAVIASRQSVYLGWRWGEFPDETAQLDRQWLQAALQRAQGGSAPLAEQPVAPPPLPINTFELLAMRQELGGLLGRVEGSLLLTQATQGGSGATEYEPILARARDVLRQLPAWVEAGQYTQARQAFEQARADLWANYPVDRLTALPEVRAIWLDRGTIVESRSETGLAQVFDRLAQAGINTVFFETMNAGFAIHPSRVAPQQNPLTRGWDPLRAAVRLAHERGMELHAWIWTFAVGNIRHNILPEINLPQDYIGPVLTAHPDWANMDDRGNLFPRGQPETWLDPANPQVRSYLLALTRELVQDYRVDGIHLDYIRYPFQNAPSRNVFGFGRAARQGFQQLSGVDPLQLDPLSDRSLWQLWTRYRTQQVNEVVESIARTARSLNPHVILSAAVYALPQNERLQKLQQDWEEWIQAGELDLLIPLTYAGNTRRLAQLVQPNLEIVSRSSALFLPSLNLLNLPAVEFLDQMQVVRDLPTGGFALFAVRQFTPELEEILSRSAIASARIPHRDPFGAIQDRFQSLQQEWMFLSEQGQLRLLEPERSQWVEQIEQVEGSLAALVADPTLETLAQARQQLGRLRENLGAWMRVKSLQNPYRVQIWGNRLMALEMMLRYGEQMLLRTSAATSLRG